MSTQEAVCVRFPNGEIEFNYAVDVPRVGDKLKRGADEWEVIAVGTDEHGHTVVTLAPPGDGKIKPSS